MENEEKDVSGFFQRPQFNAYERLLCSHLIEAVNAEPLQTVSHITRAALSIDKKTEDKTRIDKKVALSLYTISQRLATAIKNTDKWGEVTYSVSLKTVNWDRDIIPWRVPECYAWVAEGERSEKITSAIEKGDYVAAFMQSCRNLSPAGFANMVSDFLLYAVPIIENMSRQLSEIVSPETYTELMKLYHGDKN